MNKLIAIFVFAFLFLFAFSALAQTSTVQEQAAPKSGVVTRLKYVTVPVIGFSYKNGETHPIAPSLGQGLALSHKFGSWGWVTEADIVTPFSAANPAPQLLLGPLYFPSDKVYLNAYGQVRYAPVQVGKNDGMMVGGGFVLGFLITKEISFGTGIGIAKMVMGEPGPLCFVVGPKLGFTLPIF